MKGRIRIIIAVIVFIGIVIGGYITYKADLDKKSIENVYSADCVLLYSKNMSHSTLQYYIDSVAKVYSHNKSVLMQEADTKKQLKEIQVYIEYGTNVVIADNCFSEAIYWAQAYYPDVNFILLDSVPSCSNDYVLQANCVSICDKSNIDLKSVSKIESVTIDELNDNKQGVLLQQLVKCKEGDFNGSKIYLYNR